MSEFLDAALIFDPETRRADLQLGDDGDLVLDGTPVTPMLISLGSDRRAGPDDELPDGVDAPRDVSAIAANGAFLLILHKFIESLPTAERDVLRPLIELVHDVRHLQHEPNPAHLKEAVKHIFTRYAAHDAPRLLTTVSEDVSRL